MKEWMGLKLFSFFFFFKKRLKMESRGGPIWTGSGRSAVNRNEETFRGGPIWTGSNGLIWEQGEKIKNVKQGWRFSEKGRNQGRPYMDRPWNLKGVNDEPKLKEWGWQRKNQRHKVGERKNWRPQATLPQTDLTSSLTTHVCEVQVLKFWAETAWAKRGYGGEDEWPDTF